VDGEQGNLTLPWNVGRGFPEGLDEGDEVKNHPWVYGAVAPLTNRGVR